MNPWSTRQGPHNRCHVRPSSPVPILCLLAARHLSAYSLVAWSSHAISGLWPVCTAAVSMRADATTVHTWVRQVDQGSGEKVRGDDGPGLGAFTGRCCLLRALTVHTGKIARMLSAPGFLFARLLGFSVVVPAGKCSSPVSDGPRSRQVRAQRSSKGQPSA